MKNYIPVKLINYLNIEFLKSLLTVFVVFLSLSLLINFVEEITFFKEKKIDNFILTVIYLTFYKTPNTLIELSIFIFLFSGILFFIKIQKNNEMNTVLLSGISKMIPILSPAIIAFIFGIIIIITISPISASFLKLYESTKRIHSSNENLIVVNNNGLWFMETLQDGYNIIRADTISNNDFTKLKNITIYSLDSKFNFTKRIDSKSAIIKNKEWILESAKVLIADQSVNDIEKKNYSNIFFLSTLNIDELKEYFSNASTASFWNINNNIKALKLRGYSGDELKVKFYKYLSLPIYLFGVILLSTIFTINLKQEYNTITYLFIGLIIGFLLYFLNDLSIAIGLSNKLPLIISVWSPVVVIVFLSILNLITINDK